MPRIAVIVDDHPMCRQATRMALQVAHPAFEVREANSLAEAYAMAADAELMTLDLALPDNRGALVLSALLDRHPHLRVLVISGASNPEVEQHVAQSGAHGFLSKAASITDMVAALRAVIDGGRWFSEEVDIAAETEFSRLRTLTSAQARVLNAMAGGRLNKQIAHDLSLSEITIKAHVKAILKKLAMPNRTQAVLMLQRVQS